MRTYNKGWRQESERHSLASRGVKTGRRPDAIMNYSSNVAKGFENRGETGLFARGKVMNIGDLEDREDLTFVNVDYEVDAIKEYLGESAKDYDAFFVKVKDGDYAEVWGIEGNVPYLNNAAHRLVAKGKKTEAFKPNSDDKMHAVMFAHDAENVSGRLTPSKVDYLIGDEKKAVKEYKGLGLESLSHDEARHEALLKTLKKENDMPLAARGKRVVRKSGFVDFVLGNKDYPTLLSHGKKIHTAKFDRCVKKVAKVSHGKVNPYAVCAANMKYEENILPSHRRRPLKVLGLVVAGVGGYAVAKHYQKKHRREAEARRNRRIK